MDIEVKVCISVHLSNSDTENADFLDLHSNF